KHRGLAREAVRKSLVLFKNATQVIYNENPYARFVKSNDFSCAIVVVKEPPRPVVIQPYLASMDALVAAWLPGSEGQGVADAHFGDYGFTGKLARTWFKTID
ncbi:hypothetical protein IFM89_007179, partial [Coptis chinensis]